MRDFVVTAVILLLLPAAIVRPFVGVVLWTWVSVMNPHRLTWSFAYELPFAQLIAIATLLGMAVTWNKWRFPVTALTLTLISFLLWMTVTLVFAFHFDESMQQWLQTSKMLLMTLVAIAVVRSERQIHILVWVLVLSVIFFGVKGGIFTILGGGEGRVYGPPDSHIGDNNAISVALVMMIPLVVFLVNITKSTSIRIALIASAILSVISVIGSYSRGAAVAACGMLIFMMLKFRRSWVPMALLVALLPFAIMQMPDRWFTRIESIGQYEEDASMQGRFNAWSMAWNLARDRPIVGGGFAVDSPDIFARYAPVPDDVHSAHSIYFQVLGQHGFVGLGIFLALGVLMWRTGNRVIVAAKEDSSLRWSADLAKAIQVSIIGFAVGGITVNIGYWDVIYFELVVMVALEQLVVSKRDVSITTMKQVPTTKGKREIGELTGSAPTSSPRPGGAKSRSI